MVDRRWLFTSLLALGLVGAPTLWAQDGAPSAEAPAKDADAARVARLLKDLGDDDYERREEATEALIKEGRGVIARIRALHAETKDAEVKARTSFILDKLGVAAEPESTEPREGEQRPSGPSVPGMPEMPELDEMMRGLNLPDGIRKAFEGMLEGSLKDFMEPDQAPGRNRPRVRVWSNIPRLNKGALGFRHATGLRARPPSQVLRSHLDLSLKDGGLVVSAVEKGSWAEAAGIQLHDVLLRLGDDAVISLDDLDVLERGPATLELIRKGRSTELALPKRAAEKSGKERKDF
jgi:hypothetical protein